MDDHVSRFIGGNKPSSLVLVAKLPGVGIKVAACHHVAVKGKLGLGLCQTRSLGLICEVILDLLSKNVS